MKVIASKVGIAERLSRATLLGEGGRLKGESVEPGIVFLKDARVITSLAGVVLEEPDVVNKDKVVYEVIGSPIDNKTELVLVGTKAEDGYPQYVAYITADMDERAKKRGLTPLLTEIEGADSSVLSLIYERVEDLLRARFSYLLGDETALSREPYAGVVIGMGQMDSLADLSMDRKWDIYVVPWSYFPTHKTIPAFNDDGETKKRIERLERELSHGELEKETRIDILSELKELKAYYYSPDIRKAVRRSDKEGTYFISAKPEIRYMGENLRELFKHALDEYVFGGHHPVIPYVTIGLVSIPSFNVKDNAPVFSLLPLLFGYSASEPASSYKVVGLNKFFQSYRQLRGGVSDIFKIVQTGNGSLREIENASLRKKLSDIASFVSKEDIPSEMVGEYTKKLQKHLKANTRVVGSLYAVSDFVLPADLLSLLPPQETSSFGKEEWRYFFRLIEELNSEIPRLLRTSLEGELKKVAGFFYNKLISGEKIAFTGRDGQRHVYPSDEELTPYHLFPNKVVLSATAKVLQGIGKYDEVVNALAFEIPIGNVTVNTKELAVLFFFRGVLRFLALYLLKNRLANVPDGMVNTLESVVNSAFSAWAGSGTGDASSSLEVADVEVNVDDITPLEDDSVESFFFSEDKGGVRETATSNYEAEEEDYDDDEIPF